MGNEKDNVLPFPSKPRTITSHLSPVIEYGEWEYNAEDHSFDLKNGEFSIVLRNLTSARSILNCLFELTSEEEFDLSALGDLVVMIHSNYSAQDRIFFDMNPKNK